MDFFERQEKARRRTGTLLVYFAVAVVGIILSIYLAGAILFTAAGSRHSSRNSYREQSHQTSLWNPGLLAFIAPATLALIFCGSAYKTVQLASGGSAVAELLGGQPINPNTTDLDERKFLNVVEEMAIASGTPVPQVYVLNNESGINAFAAGHSTKDMAVCATRGCLRALTRDELQGVIGHEFSHILNGDMALNLRLMGIIFGILCIATIGRVLLYARGRGRDRNALPLFGLALLAIGGIGVLFGKLIKSAISREREILADASSVQFTRNAGALASALKKVGGQSSRIQNPHAEEASHLFFANGLAESFSEMFSTHPPLADRIRALDPGWDGKFIGVNIPPAPEIAALDERALGNFGDDFSALHERGRSAPAAWIGKQPARPAPPFLTHVGAPVAQHLEFAADLRANLPAALQAATRDTFSAVALTYAMLLAGEDPLQSNQLANLARRVEPGVLDEIKRLRSILLPLGSRARLPLASMSLPALRQMSPRQYDQFASNLDCLIESDNEIELFEYTLRKMVQRHLDSTFRPPKKQIVQYYVIKPLLPEAVLLLSSLAHLGQDDPAAAVVAFERGASGLGIARSAFIPLNQCGLDRVDAALHRMNQSAPPVKKMVLNACAETVAADGAIQPNEAELLRAIADALECPIPPLISL